MSITSSQAVMSLSLLQSYESDSSDADESSRGNSPVEEQEKHQECSESGPADEPSGKTSKQKTCTKVQNEEANHEHHQQKDYSPPNVPPDLLRELKAAGHDTADINIVDINPTPVSNQPHPSSHIPQYALRNNAMRLARHITKESVSSVARRKHQITALAAEAVALQVAHDTMPGAARPGSRMNGKFK